MTPALSVVIPTRDRAPLLARTLPLVLAQTMAADGYEVLVSDDGSTDDTPAVVEALARPGLRYHRAPNGGRAAARNRVLALARGDVLVFLDDDAFVPPHFLAAHGAAHAVDPAVMVTGPIVEVEASPGPREMAPAWRGYHRNPLPTCNASVRREHALRAGGFDEGLDAYGWEDMELATRLRRLGLGRRFVRTAPIFHYKPRELRRDLATRLGLERERGTMGARFYRKHPTLDVALMTKMWWPLRAADAALTPLLGLDRWLARVQARPGLAGRLPDPVHALLRCHAEIAAGRRELARAAWRSGG